jgi:hypothetical protein
MAFQWDQRDSKSGNCKESSVCPGPWVRLIVPEPSFLPRSANTSHNKTLLVLSMCGLLLLSFWIHSFGKHKTLGSYKCLAYWFIQEEQEHWGVQSHVLPRRPPYETLRTKLPEKHHSEECTCKTLPWTLLTNKINKEMILLITALTTKPLWK